MSVKPTQNLKYDFSSLSKGRLRAYNRALEELESQQDARELDDDKLDFLAAAGTPTRMKFDQTTGLKK